MSKEYSDFSIEIVQWSEGVLQTVRPVRNAVFVLEQNVPPELEWDGLDEACVHAIARGCDGAVIGTARMFPDGHIGRLAVLASWRQKGVGSALLQALLDDVQRRSIESPYLHAQTRAIGFYERHGFCATGEEFMDAGIPHRLMIRE